MLAGLIQDAGEAGRTCVRTLAALALASSLAFAPAVARAGQKSFKRCRISNGQVFSCDGAWFQGETPVERDGGWHMCRISNGKVFSCDGAWYQGTAVVYTDR